MVNHWHQWIQCRQWIAIGGSGSNEGNGSIGANGWLIIANVISDPVSTESGAIGAILLSPMAMAFAIGAKRCIKRCVNFCRQWR